MSAYAFDEDTAGSPVEGEPGRYASVLTDRWTTGNGTCNGGYVLAAALRCAQARIGSADLLTVSATFLRPGVPGPVEVATDVVRRGRRVSTAEAVLTQNDKEALRLVAQIAPLDSRSGPQWELHRPPDLPPPGQCRPAEHRDEEGVTITGQVDYRMSAPPEWITGELSGDPTLEFWVRFADGRPADLLALPFLADSYVPAALNRGATGGISVQLTAYLHRVPEPGWIACRSTSRHLVDGYCEEDAEMWDEQGRFVAQCRQLVLLT